jgi:hypothetical protein
MVPPRDTQTWWADWFVCGVPETDVPSHAVPGRQLAFVGTPVDTSVSRTVPYPCAVH